MNRIVVLLALGLVAVGPIASQAQTTPAAPVAPAMKKPVAPKVKVSLKKAETIAMKKYPGKLAGKTELENEEGKWQYAVMVRSGKTLREIMVNANTGKIDNVEVTTDDKEAKEKKDETDAARKKMEPEKKGEADEKDEEDEKQPAKPQRLLSERGLRPLHR